MSITANSSRGSIFFVTLGCAKNEVDTDRMRALLLAAGFSESESPSTCDLAIVNTCSFLTAATEESIEATLELADAAADGVRECPIVMCGCVPSRYGAELDAELPEVAAFVRAEDEDGIVDVVCTCLGQERPSEAPTGALRTVEATSAFVKISEGCNRFCSFCAIPLIRGRYVSRSLDDILFECRALLDGGVRELVLVGQDTGVWGNDLPGKPSLAKLLHALARIADTYGAWIRVLYLQPEGMTEELIAAIRDEQAVLPYIDIPVQHVSPHILRAMRRSGSGEEYLALFARLRREIPHMVLRSTLMVGFPGETEADFEDLLDFVRKAELDWCSVFAYSREDGTMAAELEGQIDEQIKLERAQELHDLVDELGFAATAAHVGETVDVIIDGIDEDEAGLELIGHTWFQAPDSDGAVHLSSGDVKTGDIVRCRLDDSFCYELEATMV